MDTIKNSQEECYIYLPSIPVESREQAMMLASEVCWDTIEVLRKRGIRGMTAKEIQEELKPKGYPQSTIYAALTQLERAAWIHSRRPTFKWGRRGLKERVLEKRVGRDRVRGGRPRKVYRVHEMWGVNFDDDFAESLDPIVEKYMPQLKETWIKILDNIIQEYRTAEKLKKFYPKDEICPDCNFEHDAYEFLTAISFGMVRSIENQKEWEELAKKHGFLKE